MSFRYRIIDPSGVEHVANGHEEFKGLLAELETKFPEDELEISADVIGDNQAKETITHGSTTTDREGKDRIQIL